MFKRFSLTATVFMLVLSLLVGSLSAVVAQQQTQQTGAKTEQSDKKESGAKATGSNAKDNQKATTATTTAAKPTSTKPLSENEDPSKIGQRKINKGIIAAMSGSIEKEVAMGRQFAAEVERQVKLIDDPVITEYINRVGQNIVLNSDAKIPFTIKVVDTDEPNAFALPGGFFYVNKGLILAADNEAEIAGVMAHEIAHVTARHTVENLAKAQLAQYGMIAGIIFGVPPLLLDASNLGLGLGFLKFNRGAEEEADRLGVQYLYAAGYDPGAMSTMFEKLASKNKKKPGFVARLFSTHPQSVDRMEKSRALVARFPERDEYVLSTSEFQRVKARLMRLSNARASTAGDISGGDDGTPGRPTLKRRQPVPDDTSAPSSTTDSKSGEEKPSDPPKLKRQSDTSNPPAQPSSNP